MEQIPSDVIFDIGLEPESGRLYCARASGLYCRAGLSSQSPGQQEMAPVVLSMTTSLCFTPGLILAGASGGILISVDRGENWEFREFGFPRPAPVKIKTSPQFGQDGLALATTMQDGVFRSEDFGRNWLPWNIGLIDTRAADAVFSPNFSVDKTVYVSTETDIYQSTNQGRSWRRLNFPAKNTPILSLAISPRFTEERTLYAGTEGAGLWRSMDGGRAWERIAANSSAINSIHLLKTGRLVLATPDALLLADQAGGRWQVSARSSFAGAVTAAWVHEAELGELQIWVGNSLGQVEFVTI